MVRCWKQSPRHVEGGQEPGWKLVGKVFAAAGGAKGKANAKGKGGGKAAAQLRQEQMSHWCKEQLRHLMADVVTRVSERYQHQLQHQPCSVCGCKDSEFAAGGDTQKTYGAGGGGT